jgi:hypothetical protein
LRKFSPTPVGARDDRIEQTDIQDEGCRNPGTRRIVMRRLVIGLVGVGSLVAVLAGLAVAEGRKPDATLNLSGGSVAAGIGFSWANGTLSYNGQTYPVKVEGRRAAFSAR